MTDLPELDRAMTPAERRAMFKAAAKEKSGVAGSPRGHVATPGTGPNGETCGTCEYIYRNQLSKTYLKCALNRANWTGGAKSDIRARDPACSRWVAKKASE